MSSSIDAGYHADQATKELQKPCPKGGKHRPKEVQKDWLRCTKCKQDFYFK